MRIIVYTLLFFLALGCGSSAGNQDQISGAYNIASQDNRVLVGDITREDLLKQPHDFWYDAQYRSYTPSKEALDVIKKNIQEYDIEIFMGTWCADSQKEVPALFKLLELSDFDVATIRMKGVELDRSLPGGLEAHYAIQRVPTFIFYRNGKEVNRFVEFPRESLEEDIAKIVSGEEYRDSYRN